MIAGAALPAAAPRLGHPPIQLFAAAIGIGGLGLAWRLANHALGAPAAIGESIFALAALVFVTVALRFAVKIARVPERVRAEIAAGLLPYGHVAAFALWIAGASLSFVTLVAVLGRWIVAPHELAHVSPAWFLPIVGNAVASYAAVPLGVPEVGWFLFAAATMCWLTMQPIVMYRLIVGDRIAPRAAPTLAIFVSSPAVLASAWFVLDGNVADAVFRILAFKALFFAVVVLRVLHLARGGGFSFAWWGYTFPLAALAAALIRYAGAVPSTFATVLAGGTLALATAVTCYIGVRAIGDAMRGLFTARSRAAIVPAA